MSNNDTPEIDELFRGFGDIDLEAEASARAVARARRALLEHAERSVSASLPTAFTPARRPWQRLWLVPTSIAAALLMAVFLLLPTTPTALADIVAAVAGKAWLHAKGTGPDGAPTEIWFSAQNGVIACRQDTTVVFIDQQQGTLDAFGGPDDSGSVQRMPLEHTPRQGIEAARESFLALLSGDVQRAMLQGNQRVLEHESKTVRLEGRELTEHRFVVGQAGRDGPRTETMLRVDPQSNLPVLWRVRCGDKTLLDCQVSYPDHGPLTIAALGVPETTPRVDLTPRGEFKQILAATNAARRRFDSYHALVIESLSADRRRSSDMCYQIWRHQGRWRVDQCRLPLRMQAPEDANPDAWWLAKAREFRSYPREIWDGKRLWSFSPVYAEPRRSDPQDPQNTHFLLIDSLQRHADDCQDRDDPRSREHPRLMPEFYAYEPLSQGASLGFRAEVRAVEDKSQPLTLVDIIQTWSRHPKDISPRRFWLDANRSHMMVRKELYRVSKPDQPEGASEVVTSARTPQGLSYPTMVRMIGNAISLEDNSRSDTYIRYYLEFQVEIPDRLFDAEAVDLKKFWTRIAE